MGDQANTVDQHTQKPGRVSLHPLKFEDALKGLLKTKPPENNQKAVDTGNGKNRKEPTKDGTR